MDFQHPLSIFFITIILDLWLLTQAELFSAVADLEPLLNTHKKIIDNLDHYIANEEKRLDILRKNLNRYKEEHILAMEDISNYLENPINAFTLIKRLTVDLDFVQNNILVSSDYVKNITTNIPDVMYPTLEDLTGAIEGLTRLQETYLLNIGELAEGRLIGRISSMPMTACDCFELGQALFDEEDYRNSLLWMMESLRKITSGDDLFYISKEDVLEYISFTHYHLGDIESAIEWSKKLLALDPEHPRARSNLKIFQNTVEENKLKIKPSKETGGDVDNDEGSEKSKTSVSIEDNDMYEALCRGDIEIPRELERRLKCSYMTINHPFLRLAPIKMEQIYIGPDVFLFHEVMSNEEIEHIKNLAKPKITRAEVVDPKTGKGMIVSYRISKAAWLHEEESEVVARIMQRTADFTGFSMDTAEDLQVANYGIGGHYEPHLDFDEEYSTSTGDDSNRIATVLFYMSDVAQGGATVFTKLGLTVFPIKYSALFWNNLLPSGKGNVATQHAACPVLRGSKWASNIWIHNIGQELVKPCSIEL